MSPAPPTGHVGHVRTTCAPGARHAPRAPAPRGPRRAARNPRAGPWGTCPSTPPRPRAWGIVRGLLDAFCGLLGARCGAACAQCAPVRAIPPETDSKGAKRTRPHDQPSETEAKRKPNFRPTNRNTRNYLTSFGISGLFRVSGFVTIGIIGTDRPLITVAITGYERSVSLGVAFRKGTQPKIPHKFDSPTLSNDSQQKLWRGRS